jgi:hypothetical protein
MSQGPPFACGAYRRIIDSYSSGDYATIDRFLRTLARDPSPWNLTHVMDGLLNAGPRWIRQAPEEERVRRRLVVAAVVLETANAGGVQGWQDAKQLIEWACSQVRGIRQPDEAERLWHRGALAVLEGAGDATAVQAHVSHALKRFRDDPRFVLARAVAAELRTGPTARAASPPAGGTI